jgi:hypothetical protein
MNARPRGNARLTQGSIRKVMTFFLIDHNAHRSRWKARRAISAGRDVRPVARVVSPSISR